MHHNVNTFRLLNSSFTSFEFVLDGISKMEVSGYLFFIRVDHISNV